MTAAYDGITLAKHKLLRIRNELGRLCLLTAVLLGLHVQTETAYAADGSESAPLYLQPIVDGRSLPGVVAVIAEKNGVRIKISDLERLGLKSRVGVMDGKGYRLLSSSGKTRAVIDTAHQTLVFSVSDALLRPNVAQVGTTAPLLAHAHATLGAYFNYNLATYTILPARDGQSALSLLGTLKGVVFSPWGELTTQTSIQIPPGQNSDQPAVARLATTYELDDPSVPRTLLVGDIVTSPPGWARANLMGGVQVATDYDLQPGAITFPTPQIGSNLSVPSTVSLLVNNASAYKDNLDVGPFSLVGIPVLSGLNSITVQTRNPSGQVSSQTVPFYASPKMLRAGLTTYATSVGFLRQNYGTLQDGYSIPSTDDTISSGLTNDLTGTLHFEASPSLTLLGGSLESSGIWGDLVGTIAVSHNNGTIGTLGSVNYSRSSRLFSLSAGLTIASPGYFDLAAENGAAFPRLNGYASIGVPLPYRLGNLNAAYTEAMTSASTINGLTMPSQTSRFLLASYSLQFWQSWSLSASASLGMIDTGGIETRSEGFNLSLNIPLGGSARGGAYFSAGSEARPSYGQSFSDLPSSQYGFGGQVQNQFGNFGQTYASLQDNTHLVNLGATVSRANGQDAGQVSAQGSIAVLDGIHFSPPLQSSFAVVDVGYPNVPVSLSNQVIGKTGGNGTVFLPNLVANYKNTISVDPETLPLTATFNTNVISLVPPLYGGVVTRFASKPVSDVLVRITEPNGSHPPPGSLIYLAGATDPLTTVGYDGQAMISDPPHRLEGYVLSGSGKCMLSSVLTVSLNHYLKGETIKCVPSPAP